MSSVKNKISQALQHNSSTAGGSRSTGHVSSRRSGTLRVVGAGEEAYDPSKHLGDLNLDAVPGGSKSSDGGGVAIGGAHNAQMSETTGTLEDGGNAHSTFNTTHSNGGAGLINKVIDEQIFTRTVDRQVVVKTVVRELHHRPLEKQYQVTTKYVGATRVVGKPTELVGTESRQIEERIIETPHGNRTVVIQNVDVPESTLQSDVISIAREHASGTHATGAVSGTATRSDRHPSQGAAAGTSAVSNSHNGTSRSYSSKVESAMATTVGVPYRISQPGTLIEEGNEIIDTHIFTKTEDHQVVVETTTYELHHRPVQKQYSVQTRLVGERRVPGAVTELIRIEEREVQEHLKELPTCDRTVVVKNVDVLPEHAFLGSSTEIRGGSSAVNGSSHRSSTTGSAVPEAADRTGMGSTTGGTSTLTPRSQQGSPIVPGVSGVNSSARTPGMGDNRSKDQQMSGTGTTGTGTGLTGTGTGLTGTGTGLTGTGIGTGTGRSGYSDTRAETGLTGSGVTSGTTGHSHSVAGGLIDTSGAQVIDSKGFTKTEDHEVLVEKKAYELQHRPVEKEYIVETKFVGEQRVAGGPTELVGTEAREVEERVVQAPAGDRAIVVENVDVSAVGQTTTSSMTGSSGMGTGNSGVGAGRTGL